MRKKDDSGKHFSALKDKREGHGGINERIRNAKFNNATTTALDSAGSRSDNSPRSLTTSVGASNAVLLHSPRDPSPGRLNSFHPVHTTLGKKPTRNSTTVKKPTFTEPTSSRVTKSQYFPKKSETLAKTNNAKASTPRNRVVAKEATPRVKQLDSSRSVSKEGARKNITRATKESVSVVKAEGKKRDTKESGERPPPLVRQNTQTKLVSDLDKEALKEQINGSSSGVSSVANTSADVDAEYDYEDDFDSYESDFDVYESSTSDDIPSGEFLVPDDDDESSTSTSTEAAQTGYPVGDARPSEKSIGSAEKEEKLDSGNYDLAELRKMQKLNEIRENIERENSQIEKRLLQNTMGSLTDEGFEDDKKIANPVQIFNFEKAKSAHRLQEKVSKRKKRGEALLNMIKLDYVGFSIYESKPIPYETFMQSFGRTGTLQVSTQTGEDNLSVEIQTNEIVACNKWTQIPATFSNIASLDSCNDTTYLEELIGVGSEPASKAKNASNERKININRLKRFMDAASQTITMLLEKNYIHTKLELIRNTGDLPFSAGHSLIKASELSFIRDRRLEALESDGNTYILTAYSCDQESDNDLRNRPIICVWNIFETIRPFKILVGQGHIKVCHMEMNGSLVFGGFQDGSIQAWDIYEDTQYHKKIIENNSEYITRYSTYATTPSIDGHKNEIVAIRSLKSDDDSTFSAENVQVCSLDECGIFIKWNVFKNRRDHKDVGKTVWGSVSLIYDLIIDLRNVYPDFEDLHCLDMRTSLFEDNHLLVSTNNGRILHFFANGNKATPSQYVTNEGNDISCIEMSPFSKNYFLCGNKNGVISMHDKRLEKFSKTFLHFENPSPIKCVQWPKYSPFSFFALDYSRNINVWNLNEDTTRPIIMVPFGKNITTMKLMHPVKFSKKRAYLAIGLEDGNVEIHLLTSEFSLDEKNHDETITSFINGVCSL